LLPQPETKATTAQTAPRWTNRARAWPVFIEKTIIQCVPASKVIVNQLDGPDGQKGIAAAHA
jgi:hypothetical protein